ncbi:hypothetical protein HPB50_016116 [Hyalomma asiaticum]|uniref:Uncharacterized protein n=1 Tax=Hyalomma asiaticum TaxID=266040 RepID=A0ACB7T2L7_HYAAI|nr:hypothetical protein HPB50_016116 [Hyalomma asiaticum]
MPDRFHGGFRFGGPYLRLRSLPSRSCLYAWHVAYRQFAYHAQRNMVPSISLTPKLCRCRDVSPRLPDEPYVQCIPDSVLCVQHYTYGGRIPCNTRARVSNRGRDNGLLPRQQCLLHGAGKKPGREGFLDPQPCAPARGSAPREARLHRSGPVGVVWAPSALAAAANALKQFAVDAAATKTVAAEAGTHVV